MWSRWTSWLAAVLLISACNHGTLTRVVRSDGTGVVGELIAARPDVVVLKIADGTAVTISRSVIRTIEPAPFGALPSRTASSTPPASTPLALNPPASNPPASSPPASGPPQATKSARGSSAPTGSRTTGGRRAGVVGRDASIASGGASAEPEKVVGDRVVPSGTTLELSLSTPIGSDTSAVDDTVDAVLRAPLVVDGEPILDAGAAARGIVTEATPSTKTDGRGRLTVRFDTIQLGPKTLPIHAAPVHWVARDLGRRAQEPRGFFQRILWKTKRGLHIGDDDNGPRGGAEVRFAPGAVLSIRVEQAARLAP